MLEDEYYYNLQTESMSPNTEEASSSQDLNEVPGNVSEYPVCNMVYPEYYVNPSCPTQGKLY